jgi:tetratricopeptide (TPR) repeat protein
MRDILEQQRNDDPEIADLKEQARSALTIADLDATERLLGAIRRRQRGLSDRRLRAAKEARADLISALEDEAETCMQQANAALLRFDTTMAGGYYRDAITVLTDTSLEIQWRYTLKGADSLREFGDFAGRNEALLASIELYRLALQAAPRDHVPLDWAMTQNKFGAALLKLGERENGTARLEEAVVAFHAALAVRGRHPFDWAMTQSNLGTALLRLGERKNVRARLEEAVTAYRAALKELSRNRDRPVGSLLWASMQNNIGGALTILAKGESGTARLKDAVTAYRAALEELSPNRILLNWAPTQNDLDIAEQLIRNGVQLDWAAVAEKLSRNPVPLEWAATQNNLGIALLTLGQRESGTARLEEASAAFEACLTIVETAWPAEWVREVRSHRDETRAEVARRLAMK